MMRRRKRRRYKRKKRKENIERGKMNVVKKGLMKQ